MLLPLGAAAIVAAALLWDLALPRVRVALGRLAAALRAHRRARLATPPLSRDPGRDRRAEQRARALLRSCVNEEEWAMYRDLGFLRVWASAREAHGHPSHAYLLYPHLPIVAYVPQTGALINEYCVAFAGEGRADEMGAYEDGGTCEGGRLPDADDVLAKWMALKADEPRLIAKANMHLPGHRLAVPRVREDLARLGRWERERLARPARAPAPTPVLRRGQGLRAADVRAAGAWAGDVRAAGARAVGGSNSVRAA